MERADLMTELARLVPDQVMREVAVHCTDEQLRDTLQAARDGAARYAALGFVDAAAEECSGQAAEGRPMTGTS